MLDDGLRLLRPYLPAYFVLPQFEPLTDSPERRLDVRDGVVRYARRIDAFRALGRLLAGDTAFAEEPRFDMLGVMVDVSRNGVLKPSAVIELLCRMALMGLDTLMLYAEDTYEVPGEPFFGYLRGAYTQDEMRSLDDAAHALGIEMFPCIQTLAHLEQITQWPAYLPLEDVRGTLLADHEPTYLLLSKMIDAASAPFRSRRIHVGMDEAHGLGTGRYRTVVGPDDPFAIFNRHLARVRDICRTRGLSPLIWSDMYFRLGSSRDDYYDLDCRIPDAVAAAIPRDVRLVYWDYYHDDPAFYEDWIERHRALGHEPVMAGGIWTWNRLWASLRWSLRTTEACMTACKRSGLREAFVTLWGDDGMECDVFSALPGLQFFAEHGHAEAVASDDVKRRLQATCGLDFERCLLAGDINAVPGDATQTACNVGKALLWQDPLLPVIDPQVDLADLPDFYRDLERRVRGLPFPAQMARVLSLKCALRPALRRAYPHVDAVAAVVRSYLRPLRQAVDRLWRLHRARWLAINKPFGLEVLEARYGALRTRLQSLDERLAAWMDGSSDDEFPELRADLRRILDVPPSELNSVSHARVKTPSAIK